jgi:hypothetical protein
MAVFNVRCVACGAVLALRARDAADPGQEARFVFDCPGCRAAIDVTLKGADRTVGPKILLFTPPSDPTA